MGEVVRAGLTGWVVEVEGAVHAVAAHLVRVRDAGGLPGVVDVVPGVRTVLLDGDRALGEGAVRRALEGFDPGVVAAPRGDVVEIAVRYDGEDLDDVGRLAGLTRDEVVEAHAGAELEVAFCGFNAGFAYLTGLPEALRVPRLDTPRTAVPAGAVAIADRYSAVYPRRSPGGWRILGSTDRAMWDERADPPALLTPGTRVRFVVA